MANRAELDKFAGIVAAIVYLVGIPWLRTAVWSVSILGLGLINFYLFIILTITGILLMFYYTPDTERAYQGIKDLEYVVSFGLIWLALGIFSWEALRRMRTA